MLPHKTLAAVAQLQDPVGFRHVTNAGTGPWTTPERWQAAFSGSCTNIADSVALGREEYIHSLEQDEEEEIVDLLGSGKLRPDGRGGFMIYEDSMPTAADNPFLPQSSCVQGIVRPLSSATKHSDRARTPSVRSDKARTPSVHVYSTPPRPSNRDEPWDEPWSCGSMVTHSGNPRDVLRETNNAKTLLKNSAAHLSSGEARLKAIDNQLSNLLEATDSGTPRGSWKSLVQLSGSRSPRAGGRCKKLPVGKGLRSAGSKKQENARILQMSPRFSAGDKLGDQGLLTPRGGPRSCLTPRGVPRAGDKLADQGLCNVTPRGGPRISFAS